MREAQKALSGFLPLIDWTRFRRRNLNYEIEGLCLGCSEIERGADGRLVVPLPSLRTDVAVAVRRA